MINNTENLSAKDILRAAKQQEKAAKKQAKEEAKKQEKEAKKQAKKQEKEAKKQEKEAKKQAKKQEKEAKKQAKKQEKEAIKQARQREAVAARETTQREAAAARETRQREAVAARETRQREAVAARETTQREAAAARETRQREAAAARETRQRELNAARETTQREAAAARETRQREAAAARETRQRERREHRNKIFENVRKAGEQAALIRPNGKFTTGDVEEEYKRLYPNINPYTLKQYCGCYDIGAAIRGLMYESSPSSQQHWFQYGYQKNREQVAPWLFANKNLASVNNDFNWKQTTSVIATARRQQKGFWQLIQDPSLRDLPEEYGKIPSAEILHEASQNRKKGARGRPPICVCID